MGLVAREPELAVIDGVLAREPTDTRAVVLVGPPGIGKTSLWEEAVADAAARGMRVLVARASAAETGLPFAGVIDLLDGVSGEDLADVPPPQRRALEVALYRAEPGEHAPTDQVVSLALLSTLRALARRAHVLVAVDDAQWLDPSSQVALAYTARRLSHHVTLLLSRRPATPTPVEQAVPEHRVDRVPVGALSLGGTRQVLAARLGLRLPHHLLRRVYDTTLGNPLFALEVGRLLARRDPERLGDELPVPDAVEELLGLRVADLHPAARRVLLALSLAADLLPDQAAVLAGDDGVDRAVAAGVVEVRGDRLRPTHPLLAEAARRAAPAQDVRALHAELARISTDDQRRALHLALAATAPDAALAARLDGAVLRATARGSIRLAADLAAHALRLTPAGDPDATRVMALAKLLQMAGEKQRLTELLAPRAATLPDRTDRVRAHLLLTGGVVHGNDDILRLLQRALDEAGDDNGLRLRVLCHLAENEAVIEVRNVEVADRRAGEAVVASAAGSAGDQRLALYTRVWTSALRGRPLDDLLERYEALASRSTYLARTPGRVAGQQHVWRGEPGPARARFEEFRSLAAARGEPSPYALARLHLCELELRVGRWDAAEALLDEWAASTDSSLLHWPMYERCRSLLAAGRGDVVQAREWAERAIDQAEETGIRWDWLESTRALGVAALLDRRPDEAVRHLRTVWEHTRREGVLDPGAFPVAPDLVEALVDVGDLDAARAVVDVLADAADLQDHPWARLAARRGAATLILGAGWSDEAADELARAARDYGQQGLAADAARTWLVLGRAQRRSRKWGASRESLECAAGSFATMGAPGWAAAARAELERVGARRPGGGRLTATERRVAELAVEGLANKEIARALVVTVSTVEFHLRNTYAKLGIRSRRELAQSLQEIDEPVS
ncbi:LuxR family transcriptional regulator [Nocardioides sp. SYSU D00065]|uniref:helix-turn-helix transcriptional regulator n=1 Tax=Nocardioides sp. SYSU D00065 TaxID=2817378 RepID=UPI001B344564|nr:LuxR family transcriptional regulator [Nocardioides sp. SYSU D00065]